MAFKITGTGGSCPEDPEALLRDLRKRTIPGPLAHQADVIREYLKVKDVADVALQLPTGSGKTLVGLLIGEWRRRKFGERVIYLCPTNQLVNQVGEQARAKYGLDLRIFVGSRSGYDRSSAADWQNGEAIAVTNYSSLFNTNPFFSDPHVIILDDAHSAENYISNYWSLLIDAKDYPSVFSVVQGIVLPLLSSSDRMRLSAPQEDDAAWVDKVPTPLFETIIEEITAALDVHTAATDLRFPWSILRDHLRACHFYVSTKAILIRPLIPPSMTHPAFAGAKQRLYMSATLGAGGDLERITGRSPIHRIAVPQGWDKQGIGRRFFVMAERSLDAKQTEKFILSAMQLSGRSLYLVPGDLSAKRVKALIEEHISYATYDAHELEESKAPFISQARAVAVVANRYDGIDLVDNECRLLFADGLPKGANLQERFLSKRVGAQLLLDDRILTRIVQGFGRCTRSPNDYAAVVVLGDSLTRYLLRKERREFFHPEIQAELEFGLSQSRGASLDDMIANVRDFLAQNKNWEAADTEIIRLRSTLPQKVLPGTSELSAAVSHEVKYEYHMWNGDFVSALESCRSVLAKLDHNDLRGYRALWLYLAGSAAWIAFRSGHMKSDDIARGFFSEAAKAAPFISWLVNLQQLGTAEATPSHDDDPKASTLVEGVEDIIEQFGTTHDRKYDAEEAEIFRLLMQDDDGKAFERGHERLGHLLGFDVGRSDEDAAPDCWWIVDGELVYVFEDNAEAKPTTLLGANKARQVASHPQWIRSKMSLAENAQIIPILLTPCTKCTAGAHLHLKSVRYWRLNDFRQWTASALKCVRQLRRNYPGEANLLWRAEAAASLRAAGITPAGLGKVIEATAAAAMEAVPGD